MASNNINWEEIEKRITSFGADIYPFEECIKGEYIGDGAAMEVFDGKCKIDMTFKPVAFKYHKEFKRSSKLNQRKINNILDEFRHEIKLMGKVKSHTNVIEIYGVTFDERTPVLIVELGNGTLDGYLEEKFESGNPASWVEKMKLCLDVLRGIRGLHDVGIIHGDIKGDNVLVFIESTGIVTAKISDFGFSSTLTSSKRDVGGTLLFSAPEAMGIYQELKPWQKKTVNDIFSFGLLTYQIATNGKKPYEGLDDPILAKNSDRDMKTLLSTLSDDTPEEFRTIIINTTKFMPTDRASIDVVEMIIMGFLRNHNDIKLTTVVSPVTVEEIWRRSSGFNWDMLEKFIVELCADIYPYEECVLRDFIGEGAVMEVFKGQCAINNTYEPVAFKYHKALKMVAKLRQRDIRRVLKELRREIMSMRKTKNHPNIIQLYGVTFHERKPILIVELGQETLEIYLKNKFKSGNPASWVEKTKLCLDVLSGIQGLHNAGITHGSINGSSLLIFIESTGAAKAKISDFNLSSTLSSSGDIDGALRFAAPEAISIFPKLAPWSGKPTRDIYSFGLITYQIATNGNIPYQGYKYYDVAATQAANRHLKILLSGLPRDAPEEFRKIIVNAAKFMPTDRASIDFLKQILMSFLYNRS